MAGSIAMGEDTNKTKIDRRDVRRVMRHIKSMRGLYAVSILLLMVMTVLSALKAFIIQPTVDTLVSGDPTVTDLYTLVAVLGGVMAIGPALNYCYALVNRVIAGRIVMNIRQQVFDHMLGQPLSFFAKHHSTDLASRVVNDIGQFEFSSIANLQMFIKDVMLSTALVGLMFYMSWTLALVCLALGGLIAVCLAYHNRRILPESHKAQQELGGVASHVTELISGMELVVSFGMNKIWAGRFRKMNQKHFDASYQLDKTRNKAIWVSHVIASTGIISILAIAGSRVIDGTLTPGSALSIIAVTYMLSHPMASFGNEVSSIVRGLGSARRAFEILDVSPDVEDPAQPSPLPEKLDIEFRNVNFSYPDKAGVLRDVSFRVDEGESIAVVGGSGAGKSTVAKLLLRFYDPTSGQVLLGGQPLDQLDRHALYENVSYVPQESFLFDTSLRENLTIGRPDATDEEVARVIKRACLVEFVAHLPNGLDSKVGERGVTLSGGERQRIAIARALLRRPKVLVLDEATSAMDVELEAAILKELVEVRAMTVVAITHRPRMAHLADRVLRLKRGAVQAEEGPLTVEG
jgi:ABC-type multidrug transport system fused ATPase/permease subunit